MARLGTFWREGLGRGQPASPRAAEAKIWVREILDLPQDATVSLNEIVCADPACPGTETVILVMVPGRRTKAYKLGCALADVTREAIAAAVTAV